MNQTVPATEFDALIEILEWVVSDLTLDTPEEVVERVAMEFGKDAGDWLGRILVDNERARTLFWLEGSR